jgi:uncharacterized protein (DUF2236 family)
MFVVDEARARLARSVRLILGGRPDPQFVMTADNDGLFGPRSVTWIIHADAAMLVGGITAVLLQTLHPSAMAAVAQHSDYRTDPLGRLRRTVSFLGTTTYGTRSEAEAAIARVVGIHSQIRGETDSGVPYRADDPHLLAWVHATEIHAFLTAHRVYGRRSLSSHQYDSYVAEMAVVGEALGVISAPRTTTELECLLDSYRPELRATELSKGAVQFLADFRLKPPASAAYRTIFTAALLLQPEWARALHSIKPGPVAAMAVRPANTALIRSIGWALHRRAPEPEASAD